MFTYKRLLELGEEITIEDEILRRAVESFEGAAIRFSYDMIEDAKHRQNYNRNILRVKAAMLAEVKEGRTSVIAAAEHCYHMRNQIMAETRAKTSVQGLAFAEWKKEIPPTQDELKAKYAASEHGKKFSMLSESEKQKVYYRMIRSSAKADPIFNALNKALRVTGSVLVVVTVVYAAFSIINAENKIKEAAKQGALIGGGVAGSTLAGLAVIPLCGPAAPICAVGVVLAGGIVGGLVASEIFELYDDELEEFSKWNSN
ncbi:hypothetical protein ACIPL1_09865 [Pseudomonas sp. NPDC090202]|uniref:hypothetical protein n=1 Tax=unclassified Pseudomonas TaxID=196821 RepID=UPI003805E7A7